MLQIVRGSRWGRGSAAAAAAAVVATAAAAAAAAAAMAAMFVPTSFSALHKAQICYERLLHLWNPFMAKCLLLLLSSGCPLLLGAPRSSSPALSQVPSSRMPSRLPFPLDY